MRIYRKEGNTIQILSFPSDNIEKGDYLLVEDPKTKRGLVTQVIDVQFASVPGILEELLRNSTAGDQVNGESFDPMEIASHIDYIQDAWVLICKIRGAIQDGKLSINVSWLPSRSQSVIKKVPVRSLLSLISHTRNLPIHVGETKETSMLNIDARALDGKLNIVTGRKATGKSHLSKLLVLGLIDYGATVVVLDLNGEYTNLGFSSNGIRNKYYGRILEVLPGTNLKVSLSQVNIQVMLNILVHALNLPGTSTREFRRIWRFLKNRGIFTLQDLGETIRSWQCNQHVRDALFSRYYALLNSGLFANFSSEAKSFEDYFLKTGNGGALVINLRDSSSIDRQIVVEYVLGRLVELLASHEIQAVFLFAEEAHLYLRETYWEDIVTRMRHFGVFTTFITNQPDTIKGNIYRQADNIFLFTFTNERDLEIVSRAARVDSETVKSIAHDLPPQYCLILGKAVKDFPIVTKVKKMNVQTMGQTRLFFTKED